MKRSHPYPILNAGVFSALAVAGFFLPCSTSIADDGDAALDRKVVIVSVEKCCPESAWPAVEHKVSSELDGLGVHVARTAVSSAAAQSAGNQLATALDDQDVVAALRIVKRGEGLAAADVLIRDRGTKKAVSKHVEFKPAPGDEGASIAALKIVELVTAGATDLAANAGDARRTNETGVSAARAPPAPSRAVPTVSAAPRDDRAAAMSASKTLAILLGAGAVPAPGNVTLLPAGFLALEFPVTKSLAIEAGGALSMPGRTISRGGAAVDFFEGAARGFLLWDFWTPHPVVATLGGGAGAVFVNASGHTAAGRTGVTDLAASGYGGVTSRFYVALTDSLKVGLCVNAGLTFPKISVQHTPDDALDFGWPLLEAAVTAAADVF